MERSLLTLLTNHLLRIAPLYRAFQDIRIWSEFHAQFEYNTRSSPEWPAPTLRCANARRILYVPTRITKKYVLACGLRAWWHIGDRTRADLSLLQSLELTPGRGPSSRHWQQRSPQVLIATETCSHGCQGDRPLGSRSPAVNFKAPSLCEYTRSGRVCASCVCTRRGLPFSLAPSCAPCPLPSPLCVSSRNR